MISMSANTDGVLMSERALHTREWVIHGELQVNPEMSNIGSLQFR